MRLTRVGVALQSTNAYVHGRERIWAAVRTDEVGTHGYIGRDAVQCDEEVGLCAFEHVHIFGGEMLTRSGMRTGKMSVAF